MLPGRFLVSNPNAIRWLEMMATPTGRKAAFGYADILPDNLASKVQVLDIEMDDAITRLQRLAKDRSGRSDPEKHFLAMGMANKLLATIQNTKAAVEQEANRMVTDAFVAADTHFAPSLSYGALHSEVRAWVREQLKLPDGKGLEVVRDSLGDPQIAAALYHAPTPLTGFAKEVHINMKNRAMEVHLPQQWKQVQVGVKLMDLPPSYDRAAKEVRGAFYEPHQIELWNTREGTAA
jgi:hypothetical protein